MTSSTLFLTIFITILLLCLLVAFGYLWYQKRKITRLFSKLKSETKKTSAATPHTVKPSSFLEGLSKARNEVWGKLLALLESPTSPIEKKLEEVEALLYKADLTTDVIQLVLEELKQVFSQKKENSNTTNTFSIKEIQENLQIILKKILEKVPPFNFDDFNLDSLSLEKRPRVILFVGVNGVGKTTTVGKIAAQLTQKGAKVVVGAGDTFRAAAQEQLEVWVERAQAILVTGPENSSPSGVIFESVQMAIKEQADYCLLDTAGRLQNNANLMEELSKTKKVIQKLIPSAPHQTLLVLDALSGKNILKQAEEFHKYLQLSGIVMTKCDSSSKAGGILSLVHHLSLPVAYIGIGEKQEDLKQFHGQQFLEGLIGNESQDSAKLT